MRMSLLPAIPGGGCAAGLGAAGRLRSSPTVFTDRSQPSDFSLQQRNAGASGATPDRFVPS
jgi:hypothetical protein